MHINSHTDPQTVSVETDLKISCLLYNFYQSWHDCYLLSKTFQTY